MNLPELALTLLISFFSAGIQGAESDPARLEISQRFRTLQPGEVVLISATSNQPLKSLEGKIFQKTFYFYPDSNSTLWSGLIGIDLNIPADLYRLNLQGVTLTGSRFDQVHDLRVSDKEFPTRHVTVEQKYVDPPPEELKRIGQESKRVKELFATTSPARIWEGPFLLPVPGTTTSGFGRRSIINGKARSPHSGTDLRAKEGTPVKAPNAGLVVLVSNLYFSGNTVIVDHGQGLYSYFAHLSRFATEEGERVVAGQIVGHVGATGRVTGPHLHWTVRLNQSRVDPLSLIAVLSGQDLD